MIAIMCWICLLTAGKLCVQGCTRGGQLQPGSHGSSTNHSKQFCCCCYTCRQHAHCATKVYVLSMLQGWPDDQGKYKKSLNPIIIHQNSTALSSNGIAAWTGLASQKPKAAAPVAQRKKAQAAKSVTAKAARSEPPPESQKQAADSEESSPKAARRAPLRNSQAVNQGPVRAKKSRLAADAEPADKAQAEKAGVSVWSAPAMVHVRKFADDVLVRMEESMRHFCCDSFLGCP